MSNGSDSEDDPNLPSAEECDKRIRGFAEITGTNTALAMFFLQSREYNLERAVNAFYEQGGAGAIGELGTLGGAKNTQTKTFTVPVPKNKDGDGSKAKVKTETTKENKSSGKTESATSAHSQLKSEPDVEEIDPEPHRIRLISWNIDGLEPTYIVQRTKAVCTTINNENPDVVYLQEVVPQTVPILEENCPMYQLIPGNVEDYFTAIMLKISSVVYKDHRVIDFPTTKMSRNLLSVQASVKGVDVHLMTSHLESTAEHSEERVRQLRVALKHMTDTPDGRTVLFGGDLNMRDKEVASIGGLPPVVLDLWEATGKRPEARYTWDLTRNDNLQWTAKFRPRCRFDRIYMRHNKPGPKLKPVYFELIGIQRLGTCRRFPSDHWGLLTHFDIISKVKNAVK